MPTNNAYKPPQHERSRQRRDDFQDTDKNSLRATRYPSASVVDNKFLKFTVKNFKLFIILAIIISLICLSIFILINRNGTDVALIPVIEAEQGPIKVRPTESHRAVLHGEKTIYSVLSSQEPTPKVENLLSEPEKPQAQNPSLPEDFMRALDGVEGDDILSAATFNQMNAVKQSLSNQPQSLQTLLNPNNNETESPSYANDSGEDVEDVAESDEPLNINVTASPPQQSIFLDEANELASPAFAQRSYKHDMSLEKLASEIEAADIKVNSSKIVAPKINKHSSVVQKTIYRAQICSASSKKAAEQQWLKIYKRTPQLLSGFKPTYEKVDLGAKVGIRYRVQIGQFNHDSAKKFCLKLKAKGLDCAIVRQSAQQ